MTDLKKFRKEVLDSISPSFCAAKWYNATIWLNTGLTASCHLPEPHPIPIDEIKRTPAALHNTEYKKEQRRKMLRGERPEECSYCWKIEDIPGNEISERTYKSLPYKREDISNAPDLGADADVVPRRLEIAFDRVCNFACLYCNPQQSTTWGKDIAKHGSYEGLPEDGWVYRTDGSETEPYGKLNQDNPYIQAFWDWWPELSQYLDEIRITGGEPAMSPHFNRFMDRMIEEGIPNDLTVSINTNLGMNQNRFEDFFKKLAGHPQIHLFTSCEATGERAEYLRDGIDYELFHKRLKMLVRAGSRVTVMSTLSLLAVWDYPSFIQDMIDLKGEANRLPWCPIISTNILRNPSFMSPLVMPPYLRSLTAKRIEEVLERNRNDLRQSEYSGIQILIDYLRNVETPAHYVDDPQELKPYFVRFHQQYDKRRGRQLETTFGDFPELIQWYQE